MKMFTMYERLKPDTVSGHAVKVTTIYSSFNINEIDKLQEELRNSIASGVVSEVSMKEEEG